MQKSKPSVALADDRTLLRASLAAPVKSYSDYDVAPEVNNGKDFINELQPGALPDIVLLDINMPDMDGYETASWLRQNYPEVKVLALSMYDSDQHIIRMMKNGVRGYILKDIGATEFKRALDTVTKKGYYYAEVVTGKIIDEAGNGEEHDAPVKEIVRLNPRELQFLKLVCTELTYREIAEKMFLSPRTIDGYRDDLFVKLKVKTRVGLAMYAIKNGIVTL